MIKLSYACQVAKSRDRINVVDVASTAKPLEINDIEALEQATRHLYSLPVHTDHPDEWKLPAGAYGREGCGSV